MASLHKNVVASINLQAIVDADVEVLPVAAVMASLLMWHRFQGSVDLSKQLVFKECIAQFELGKQPAALGDV
jgi:hypothetical protein